MALPTMSGRVAKDFGRVSVKFGGAPGWSGVPPGTPPGSLLGGQQVGCAPFSPRRETEANTDRKRDGRTTPRTRRRVGGFKNPVFQSQKAQEAAQNILKTSPKHPQTIPKPSQNHPQTIPKSFINMPK